MSLPKWQALAKSQTDLGQNINVVYDAFFKHDLRGQKINQEALSKVPRKAAQVPDYALDDDHVEAVPDYALDRLQADPELEDLIDVAKPDQRRGPKPGQGRDDKLFAYWCIPSYDEVEEDLKGITRAEESAHNNEILGNGKKRSRSLGGI